MNANNIDTNRSYMAGMNQIELTYGDKHDADKMTKHYVMWSGGTDSTLLLYELLQCYGPDRVIAISYVYPWLSVDKMQSERAHRKAFMATAALRGLGEFKHMELIITQENVQGNMAWAPQGSALPQALAWLLSVPVYAEKNSYIYDGAIRDDDLTLRLEDYHRMFRGMSGVMGDRNLTLREPYLFFTKANVLEKLIDYGLYEETWFCELPSSDGDGANKPCLRCASCKTHMAALDQIIYTSDNERIRVLTKYYLEKLRPPKTNVYNITDAAAREKFRPR